MKIKYLSLSTMPLAASALVLMAGCTIEPPRVYIHGPEVVAPAPVVVAPVPPPPPPAPVVVEVPDYYVWDGFEYVGYVGDSCFYLGPGNVWVVCEPFRLARFHDWEHGHPDWRVRLAVHNDNFRKDRYGHVAPRRDERGSQRQQQERREDHRDDHRNDQH